MRRLLLAPELFTGNGGIPRILRLYTRVLSEPGSDRDSLSLLALGDHSISSTELRSHNSGGLLRWTVCRGNRRHFVLQALKQARRTDRVICGHLHLLPVALLMRLLHPGLRYDLVAHGIEVWKKPSPVQRLALAGARSVLSVSAYTKERLVACSGIKPAKIQVVHNGLDPSFPIASTATAPAQAPLILCVSRLCASDAYKGVDQLIRAFAQTLKQHPEARLRIIGQGDDSGRLRRLADSLGLGSRVDMRGHLSDTELNEALDACTLFALPSTGEGFGLVYLEAMAHGRPCVGARAGGVPEVLDSASGILVEPGDLKALADALSEALLRKWEPEAILARARSFSYGQFRQRLQSCLADLEKP